jgi:hypothetical protein
LIGTLDLVYVFILVDVNGHKFIADFWSMFRGIGEAKIFSLHSILEFWFLLQVDIIALYALVPADFVEAFTEEDDISEDGLVEFFVHALTCAEKI